MKTIKFLAVFFAFSIVMSVFSPCEVNAMSIDEAVGAINNLKHGGSITIVLNSDVMKITDKLQEALVEDLFYIDEIMESEDLLSDEPTLEELLEFFQKYAKKVKLDLSKTKITEIEGIAFVGAMSLASVTMPENVTSIGDSAFEWCMLLSSVIMPESVTSIGDSAFSSCSSLKSVTIPNSVTSIGDSAFSSCFSLKSVTIPNSVTSIGDSAFRDCISLTSVTIPDGVISIGYRAFLNCQLTSVRLPDTIIQIEDAFDDYLMVTYKGKTDTWEKIRQKFFGFRY